MFKHPFSFEGRIGRREYAITYVAYIASSLIIKELLLQEYNYALILLFIPSLWILFAQGSKRCHDLGKGAGWQFIPFYGLWMLFQSGDPGANQYGMPNSHPKDNPAGSLEREIDSIGKSDIKY
ncbi:DUF805 domain-containing protein [Chitinophaga filiformis]|uniref:DUF805 domain-containing protein n=1 Tax=Chitinophaga filiformis TaxID=104663 RepID=UPI001F182CEA|nr:DUF805 domain-containing protein [Chitinophaga filiformis]MCF6407106.1 DUF805 domain-containing protein [Chitinophaga filiformis]